MIVDEEWSNVITTPKMRGFKQIFISLFLYNVNKFIDGKKVEWAHQIGKNWQTSHNNFKQLYKLLVSTYCSQRLALFYLINGGKWGNHLQYCIGQGIRNLKHPLKANATHPLLDKWLIRTSSQPSPKVEVTNFFANKHVNRRVWRSWFVDRHGAQLEKLIQTDIDANNTGIYHILSSNNWQIKRIKSFRFHAGNSSFNMCFNNKNIENTNLCIVKLVHGYIFKFNLAFEIKWMDEQQIYVCKGDYFPIHQSLQPNQWLDDFYSSMDYIDLNQQKTGWVFLTNIH